MKDHEFTVPKDLGGKSVYVSGMAYLDTTSVETLQDFPKDAGRTQEQIAAIKDPQIQWVVEADGVMLEQ